MNGGNKCWYENKAQFNSNMRALINQNNNISVKKNKPTFEQR